MKKLIALILVFTLLFTLAGCGGSEAAPSGGRSEATSSGAAQRSGTSSSSSSAVPVAPSTSQTGTPEQEQTEETDADNIPVRIEAFTKDGEQKIYIALDLPNNGDFSMEATIGNSHIQSEPSSEFEGHPFYTMRDSSDKIVVENVMGSIDPWGVEVQVSTSNYNWDLDNISTVKIECTSDAGNTISGEYDLAKILVENGSWYSRLKRNYENEYGPTETEEKQTIIESSEEESADTSQSAFPSGGSFQGDMSGYGVWTYNNYSYEGNFVNGVPNGTGTLSIDSAVSSSLVITITGTWADGYAEGEITYSQG